MNVPKQSKVDGEENIMPKEMEERRVNEVAVAGGGVSVAVTRFPPEQKRPVGPLVVVGVRDGVLWLVDRLEFPPLYGLVTKFIPKLIYLP